MGEQEMRRFTWLLCGLMALMAVTVMLAPAAADAAGSPTTYVAGPGGVNASDATDGNICIVELSPCATIAAALLQTEPGGTIEVSGTLTPSNVTQVDQDVTIEADPNSTSSPRAEINGSSESDGVLSVYNTPVTLTVTGITFTESVGSAITAYLSGGTLNVSDSTFSHDADPGAGGAIDADGPETVVVSDSTFTDNSAAEGGAIADPNVDSGDGTLTVTGSTFTGNTASNGGAISNAIANATDQTTLAVGDSTFTDNTATGSGGAIVTADDGLGEADITGSTFSGNAALQGGAISNGLANTPQSTGPAILTITDSTLYDNTASLDGGAIDNAEATGAGDGGDVTIIQSTLSGNTATTDGNTIDNGDNGGSGTVTLGADVIAGTCYTGTSSGTNVWHDAGDNVTSSSSCPQGATNGVDGDVVLSSLASDLGPLQSNGGPTQTMQLLAGNPAIDLLPNPFSHQLTVPTLTGSSTVTIACPVSADQRGIASAAGAGCDVGAVQFASANTIYLAGSGGVHAGAASDGNVCSNEATPCATLAGALAQAAPGGTVELSGTLIQGAAAAADQDVTIEANPDGSSATIAGAGFDTDGLLTIGDDTVTIHGLTLEDGIATSANQGGAISNNAGGVVDVADSIFIDDSADDSGGAIVNGDDSGDEFGVGGVSGTASITDSSFIDDVAVADSSYDGDGGSIDNGDNGATGTLTVSDSTFNGETAVGNGGAIDSGDHSGIGTATVSDSTFTANTAGVLADGGAIDNGDDGGTGTLTVIASTFAGNVSAGDGNTIDNEDHGGTGTVNFAADVWDGSCDESSGTWDDDGFNAATSSSCLGSPPSGRPDATAASATADLGTLAANGGSTQTMELLDGNPAINLIPSGTSFTVPNPSGGTVPVSCPVVTDQRGVANAGSTGCDAGAAQLATQSVGFGTALPSSVVVGQSGATVSPSSSSGLAVSLTLDPSTTNSACAVSGDAVSFAHAGSCVLNESQAGNTNFGSAQGQRTITVNAAQTSTAVSAGSSAVSATVSVVAPGAGAPSGTVLFSVGGQTIGSATLVDGVASLSYSVAANTTQSVTASYQGSDDYAGSSSSATDAGPTVSTPTTTATTTTTTTTPTTTTTTPTPIPTTPTRTVVNPRITATITSARPKTANGWWTSAVKVSFHCTTHGSPLTAHCPASVRFDRSGRGQKLTRTVHARNGGHASITVSGLNIDLSKPSIKIAGANSRAHYLFHGSPARCLARDAVSGVRSCTLTRRVRRSADGQAITYTATATSNAGTSARTSVTIQVRMIGLLGAQAADGVYRVQPGATYTLEVLSKSRPVYLDAAVSPLPPNPAHEYFLAAGELDGVTLWKLEVRIEPGFNLYKRWSIGVRTGPTTHRLQLST
jgi:predicted outer membrane repeat protein